ncbi:hypothetical protein SYNPS1DRAFT_21877 [Syncephalis pseudoplumigaleata]|uniref:JAB1/MPN/MOV34 metalloenzyme domain-containing protein n=1 Tax=Syncephalis pseudoplumigaleata TaxID=1712513 RepID=A0A4P9Z466_9FUNG|nr:hypothetical protein SYNPS1DRAFT_21877 [Syncephalis pseudoplumigaleata]|eukprot:RKP26340.1 hypothetical protein SYNPS1DRAFT_21877 [Syncephalis pseudoplumigaleata]
MGALYGTQDGRDISIHTTYELLCKRTEEGRHTIDVEYYMNKADQMKQVLAGFDVLGWYLVTTEPMRALELDLHQRMQEYNENPLYLRLNPEQANLTTGTLPATIYDTEMAAAVSSGSLRAIYLSPKSNTDAYLDYLRNYKDTTPAFYIKYHIKGSCTAGNDSPLRYSYCWREKIPLMSTVPREPYCLVLDNTSTTQQATVTFYFTSS